MQEQNTNNLKNNLKRKPQWGNAAWKAAMRKHAIQPNYANRMRCVAIARHSGRPCGQLAMRGVPCCRWHGGNMMQAQRRNWEAKRNANETAVNRASQQAKRRFKQSSHSKDNSPRSSAKRA